MSDLSNTPLDAMPLQEEIEIATQKLLNALRFVMLHYPYLSSMMDLPTLDAQARIAALIKLFGSWQKEHAELAHYIQANGLRQALMTLFNARKAMSSEEMHALGLHQVLAIEVLPVNVQAPVDRYY